MAEMNECALEEMREEISNAMIAKHSFTFDSFNICEIVKSSALKNFTIQMLCDICKHFEIDVSGLTQRHKKPYLDLITGLVRSCTCEGK